MALSRTLKRSYNAAQLRLAPGNATTGVWTTQLSAGLYSLHKAAVATTSVVNIPIPHGPRGGVPTNEDAQIALLELFYLVSTANLTSAPTAVLNKLTLPGGAVTSGFAANAVVAQVLSFSGVDTVGTVSGAGQAGSHIAVVTVTVPFTLNDADSLILTITMNEAATSVLDLFGLAVTYQ
jgi:hypothetical protein